MKIGDSVKTSEGMGIIIDKEISNHITRYGVKLDNNPFDFSPAYYYKTELELIKWMNVGSVNILIRISQLNAVSDVLLKIGIELQLTGL